MNFKVSDSRFFRTIVSRGLSSKMLRPHQFGFRLLGWLSVSCDWSQISAKRKLKETKDGCIYVPVDETKVVAKTPYSKNEASLSSFSIVDRLRSLSSECSSTSIEDRLRSNKSKPKEDVDVKSTFPPPIDFALNQDKRTIKAVSYARLREKKYFVDKTDLIRDIYMDEVDDKYIVFREREQNQRCFEGTKIMALVEKEADGTVKDGAIGFNNHIVIMADFALVQIKNLTFEEIKSGVKREFCRFLISQYSLNKEAEAEIMNLNASDSHFFRTIVSRVKDVLPQTTSAFVKRSVLMIIDNFDSPVLRILNREKSTELALEVMDFFNFMLSDQKELVGTVMPAYWCSVDSLDILSDTSSMLRYEMPLWTYHGDESLHFQYKVVLIYENLIRNLDTAYDTAYTYLLEAGYLTRVENTDPPTYRIVNGEARNLLAA
ncbi:hypothetical protein U1Q18_047833 [Sarracenia purpurea var. burkii]